MGNSVEAIVVTYNRYDLLKQCIQALRNQSIHCDILVINNASTDETRAYLDEQPDIRAVHMMENTGGAGGFFEGMRQAALQGYEYAWVMDDDCIPKPNALEELIRKHNHLEGKEGWLSSRCLWTDGKLCPMNIQRKTPYKDIRSMDMDIIPAQMASFVSLFLPVRIIREIGLPFREFVIWSDDWEYTRRISRKYPCYVVRDSIVVHAMKSAKVVSIATDSEERLPRYRYFYRNDVVLYRREGLPGWWWLLLKDIWHSFQTIRQGKTKRLPVIWKGFLEGCRFYPKIEYP